MINVFAALAAATLSVAVQLAHTPLIGFFAAGFTSTTTYIVSLALLLWWSAPRRTRSGRQPIGTKRSTADETCH
jgi:hypothetical protein